MTPRSSFRVVLAVAALAAIAPTHAADLAATPFRVRPYLQNPAPDAMTVRWLSEAAAPGTLTCDGRTFTSTPVLTRDLDYQMAEPAGMQHASPPFLHSVRVTGLEPATSYPYAVE